MPLVAVNPPLPALPADEQLVVEGHLGDYVGRRRMDRRIADMKGHVIVCGWGRVGRAVAHDLRVSGRDVVVVDMDRDRVAEIPFTLPIAVFTCGFALVTFHLKSRPIS